MALRRRPSFAKKTRSEKSARPHGRRNARQSRNTCFDVFRASYSMRGQRIRIFFQNNLRLWRNILKIFQGGMCFSNMTPNCSFQPDPCCVNRVLLFQPCLFVLNLYLLAIWCHCGPFHLNSVLSFQACPFALIFSFSFQR